MVNADKQHQSPHNDDTDLPNDLSVSSLLSEILEVEEADVDLIFQSNDMFEALDMQVIGACRSDERLKPFLKLNASNGAAEDLLLAHLSQHFEAEEIGMLARCLCVPLVSIRVGKIEEQGVVLCPTDKRGNLNLILLPTSDLRILFLGDDGLTERLSTFSFDTESSSVEINRITADQSRRSFSVKIRGDKVYYFWCSEKSKLLGDELLQKMKDLLNRRPNLSELTGISESRLDYFAIQLRAYLPGSSMPSAQAGSTLAEPTSLDNSLESLGLHAQSSITYSNSSHQQHQGNNGVKASSICQGSLGPKPSAFQEGIPMNLSSSSVSREEIKHCLDNSFYVNDLASSSSGMGLNKSENDKLEGFSFPPLESLGGLADSSLFLPPATVSSLGSPFFSPYYVQCPPFAAIPPPSSRSLSQLPFSSSESFSLRSLTSLLSPAKSSSLLSSIPPMNIVEFPPLEFPPLFPEPLVRSQVATSQQIVSFTPLMCDPIVHIPVLDCCSSGQGYLVSAGSAISAAIPPLHPSFMGSVVPETESVVEKSARETLRLLINSSNQSNFLLDVLPSVTISSNEQPNIYAAGSRGMYTGTRDIHAITGSITAMGLIQLGDSVDAGIERMNAGRNDSVNPSDNSATSSFNDGPAEARRDEWSETAD